MGISYRRLGNGKHRADIYDHGRRRSVQADTRAEVQRRAAQILIDLGVTPRFAADIVIVQTVLDQHIADGYTKWSPQYAKDLRLVADRLPEDFRSRPANKITAADIAALYSRLSRLTGKRNTWSAHRLQRVHGLLSGAFRRAAIAGWVPANPCTDVAPPQPAPSDVRVPTAEQVVKIIAAATGPAATFFRLAAITGARRGELVGLQWADISTSRGEVVIRRALSVTGSGYDQTIYQHAGKTGRKGHRVLVIDPETLTELAVIRERDRVLATQRLLPEPLWVFSHTAGASPWYPDYPSIQYTKARAAANLEGIRLHDFRHYVATTMLQDGEPPVDVAAQLGDSIQTVLRVYAHFMPGRGRDAALRRAAGLATP